MKWIQTYNSRNGWWKFTSFAINWDTRVITTIHRQWSSKVGPRHWRGEPIDRFAQHRKKAEGALPETTSHAPLTSDANASSRPYPPWQRPWKLPFMYCRTTLEQSAQDPSSMVHIRTYIYLWPTRTSTLQKLLGFLFLVTSCGRARDFFWTVCS